MQELNHTPGEWYSTGDNSILSDKKKGGKLVAAALDPEDARLIAAAPDLLQAALLVQKYFRKMDHGFIQELTNCANAINKAIEKAILPPPRYKHDCDHCVYLGQYFSQSTNVNYDLYWGSHGSLHKSARTVIARYGNEGYEYHSGYNSSLPPLIEAQRLATEKGFI